MEQKEIDHAIEVLNSTLNQLDRLRTDLLKQSRKEEKTARKKSNKSDPVKEITKEFADMNGLNQELTIKQILEKYDQPTDSDHIESINKIVANNHITLEELDSCIDRVKSANDKDPKNDIKKYTYSCLYKINRA